MAVPPTARVYKGRLIWQDATRWVVGGGGRFLTLKAAKAFVRQESTVGERGDSMNVTVCCGRAPIAGTEFTYLADSQIVLTIDWGRCSGCGKISELEAVQPNPILDCGQVRLRESASGGRCDPCRADLALAQARAMLPKGVR